MTAQDAIHALWAASIATPIDSKTNGARVIAIALNLSLADIFALYQKTKSYHWHMSGVRTSGIVISCRAIASSSILAKSTGWLLRCVGTV
jgi:hypothetical protein